MKKPEPNLALRRSKQTGAWICFAALCTALLFVIGLLQGSYWALAVPVSVGVLSTLSLLFWIGYTINTIDALPAEAEVYSGSQPRRIALFICIAAVVLSVWFLIGVFLQSYLALALPVAVVVLGLLAMVFWIGWTIFTRPVAPLQSDSAVETEASAQEAVPPSEQAAS